MSILSVDSMAVYKGLDILTAKPTDVMQAQVKYYGLDIADPDQNFSIIDYVNYLIDQDIPEKLGVIYPDRQLNGNPDGNWDRNLDGNPDGNLDGHQTDIQTDIQNS